MTDISPEALLEVALEAARAGGDLLAERFGAPARGLATKSSPTDWVSDADRDAETVIGDVLHRRRPRDGILAEEGTGRASETGLVWVVDPLDGTINFLYGIPVWCVSIACEDEAGALVGVVYDPNRSETFTARRGDGAFRDGEQIRVSEQARLSQALVATGFAYEVQVRELQARKVGTVLPLVRDIRRGGSAALDLAWTACGRVDAFYEAYMERWDRAAGELLVREAGGAVSSLPAPIGSGSGLVAANPTLHDALREVVG